MSYAKAYVPTKKEKETRARMKLARLPLEVKDPDGCSTTTYYFYHMEGDKPGNYIVETEIEYHEPEETNEEEDYAST